MNIHGSYEPRRIASQEVWGVRGWTLKVYGIAYGASAPRHSLIEAAKATAARILPDPPITAARYGVGFLCAHEGRTCDVAFIDWWENEDELHHHMFMAEGDALRPSGAGDFAACSWDLALLSFERDAWVNAILKNPSGPNIGDYLSSCMNQLV